MRQAEQSSRHRNQVQVVVLELPKVFVEFVVYLVGYAAGTSSGKRHP